MSSKVHKYNLTVPPLLAEAIEANRDGLGNLSKIFQEAVQARITALEAFKGKLKTATFEDLDDTEKQWLRDCLK